MDSIWTKTAQLPQFEPLRSDLNTDVLIIGGGLGNILDRVRLGYVVDMFCFQFMEFPVFNVADICIDAGCALGIVYYLWFYEKYDKGGGVHGNPAAPGV